MDAIQQWRAEILCDIPFFDIESVVMTGVNFTTVPVGTVVVALVLPKPADKNQNDLKSENYSCWLALLIDIY